MNTSFLQHLLINSHHKLKKITKILSKHSNFCAIVPKAKQIQFQSQSKKKNMEKDDIQNAQKKFVYFKA